MLSIMLLLVIWAWAAALMFIAAHFIEWWMTRRDR